MEEKDGELELELFTKYHEIVQKREKLRQIQREIEEMKQKQIKASNDEKLGTC